MLRWFLARSRLAAVAWTIGLASLSSVARADEQEEPRAPEPPPTAPAVAAPPSTPAPPTPLSPLPAAGSPPVRGTAHDAPPQQIPDDDDSGIDYTTPRYEPAGFPLIGGNSDIGVQLGGVV